ncbi:MAG: hypothetical protein K2X27_17315, partial [Candidatus Obscuribacterales bacterium]|nr:hypothetical protein [Candidatus Obscuribacterales bacterium]
MFNKRSLILGAFTILLSAPALCPLASAQGGGMQQSNSQVTMTVYQVVRESDGKQYVISKNGQPVFIPGLNIASNAQQIQVYRDGNNNFWYIDKKGRPTAITHNQLQWVVQELQQGQPQQGSVTNNYYNNSQQSSGSRSGGSGLGTALAAGIGAATGAAIGTAISEPNYYGVPYGAPLYRGGAHGNQMYYYKGGNQVYVNNTVQHNNMVNQWNSQKNWEQMSNRVN